MTSQQFMVGFENSLVQIFTTFRTRGMKNWPTEFRYA